MTKGAFGGTMLRRGLLALAVAAAAGGFAAGSALAGDQVLGTVVEEGANPSDFHLTKHGKLITKPSTKAGDGGMTSQLVLTGIDCPPPGPGNDGGTAGKCGAAGSPVVNHVLVISSMFLGVPYTEVAGIKYKIEKGKAVFQLNGKNKIGGGAVFGPIVSAVYNQALGLGPWVLRTAGSDPLACDTVPLGSGSGCTDGSTYAVMGIVVASDAGISCTTNSDCSLSNICTTGCTPEPCSADSDCDQNGTGNGGTGQCAASGVCCDPALDPTCAAQM